MSIYLQSLLTACLHEDYFINSVLFCSHEAGVPRAGEAGNHGEYHTGNAIRAFIPLIWRIRHDSYR